jgi:hypothetical protein
MTIPGLVLLCVGLLLLTTGCTDRGPRDASAAVQGGIMASTETDPVPHDGEAADDPAIWVHPKDPGKSVILGTDKKGAWRCTTWPAGSSSTCRQATSTMSTCEPAPASAAGW